MKKEKLNIVIDTETCGDLKHPIVYDLGYVVAKRDGTILEERNFILKDVFYGRADLVKMSFFGKHYGEYERMIKNDEVELMDTVDVKNELKRTIEEYSVNYDIRLCAYNMAFDKKALQATAKYISGGFVQTWFTTEKFKYECIWNMACQTVCNTKKYIKWALENGYVSDKGNITTNAETVYKYMFGAKDFKEDHMALSDARIELQILTVLDKRHERMKRDINPRCWAIPQKKRG